MSNVHTAASSRGSYPPYYRWLQLIMGIICMAMIANLQYGWTLFVDPIDARHHWGRAAIQLAFSVFVVTETWLVPVEAWFVDRYGPRVVIAFGGVMIALAWVLELVCEFAADALSRGRDRRYRRGLGLRHLRRQRAEMVSRSPRSCRRRDRSGLRRGRRDHRRSDRQDDRRQRLRAGVLHALASGKGSSFWRWLSSSTSPPLPFLPPSARCACRKPRSTTRRRR